MQANVSEPLQAYSIREFCQAHSIGQSLYFEMQKAGIGPEIIRIGRRVLISKEAAAAWRKKMAHPSRKVLGR